MIPHIHRLKSLTIDAEALPRLLQHFRCRTPLLEKLDIHSLGNLALDGALFNGDLSSLRELRLRGIITYFPWKNLANLQVVNVQFCFQQHVITRLLDFFESAPLLHTVFLWYSMLNSSEAPPKRIVHLRNLKVFTINAPPPHSILLRHLHIPTGASLISEFRFRGEELPLLDHLSVDSPNLRNLSHITTMNLLFDMKRKFARLSGPSGSLRVLPVWEHSGVRISYLRDGQILRSLGHPMLSRIQRLVISEYRHPRPVEIEECPIFKTLSSTHDLRTLTLIDCNYLPFVLALDPEQNPSNLALCPNLEELVLYIPSRHYFRAECLISMEKNRASRGVKLLSITIVGLGELAPREVLKLREHIAHVEYRVEAARPAWDSVPGQSCSGNE